MKRAIRSFYAGDDYALDVSSVVVVSQAVILVVDPSMQCCRASHHFQLVQLPRVDPISAVTILLEMHRDVNLAAAASAT